MLKFPPSRLHPFQKVPPISPEARAGLAAAAPATTLPRTFDWRLAEDIKTRTASTFSLSTPVNQGTCGNCWACSIALVLTDRFAIQNNTSSNQLFSVNWLTSCNLLCPDDNACVQGCDGADLGTAIRFLSLNFGAGGIPLDSCIPWVPEAAEDARRKRFSALKSCQKDLVGANSPSSSCNTLQEKCAVCDTNASHSNTNVFVNGAGQHRLLDIESIKQDIWLHGPVAAAFQVFADFQYNSTGVPAFQSTAEVYIYDGAAQSVGFHAVSIVGWGEKSVVLPNQGPVTVPYWIVRNSWGTGWGDMGYWLHAMQNSRQNINVDAGLEGVLTDNQGFRGAGGVISFMPELRPGNRNPPSTNGSPIKKKTQQKKASPDKKKGHNVVLVVLVVVVLLVLLVLLLMWKSKQQK
jgi:hypothetical protein